VQSEYICPICEKVHLVDVYAYDCIECSCGNTGYWDCIQYDEDGEYFEELIWDYYVKEDVIKGERNNEYKK
jgi:hypothetical protein